MIDRDLGIKLPCGWAASIASHIVNAEYDAPMGDTIKITNLISRYQRWLRKYFNIKLDEQSLSYERFITHLRFLAQRVFTGEHMELDNLEFQRSSTGYIRKNMPADQKVQALIKLQYGHQVTEEEVAYLALHIKRIRTKVVWVVLWLRSHAGDRERSNKDVWFIKETVWGRRKG